MEMMPNMLDFTQTLLVAFIFNAVVFAATFAGTHLGIING